MRACGVAVPPGEYTTSCVIAHYRKHGQRACSQLIVPSPGRILWFYAIPDCYLLLLGEGKRTDPSLSVTRANRSQGSHRTEEPEKGMEKK